MKVPIIEFSYDIKSDIVKDVKESGYLVQLNTKNNNQFVNLSKDELSYLGECEYKFRKGIGYKGEVYKLKFNSIAKKSGKEVVTAIFNTYIKKGKFLKVSDELVELEVKYIYPLVMSPHLKDNKFLWDSDKTYVVFPYKKNTKTPVDLDILSKEAPLLYKYIKRNKLSLKQQSSYNQRVQNTTFWGVIRVGFYTFSDIFVAIRDNTRLNPVLVTKLRTDWGEVKMPLFDGHISYISQRPDKNKLTIKEAKYILNKLKAVEPVVLKIYDNRSISSRLPINLPLYKENNG